SEGFAVIVYSAAASSGAWALGTTRAVAMGAAPRIGPPRRLIRLRSAGPQSDPVVFVRLGGSGVEYCRGVFELMQFLTLQILFLAQSDRIGPGGSRPTGRACLYVFAGEDRGDESVITAAKCSRSKGLPPFACKAVVLFLSDGHDRAVAGRLGKVVVAGDGPLAGIEVGGLDGHVATTAPLVDEEVPFLLGVGLEDGGSLPHLDPRFAVGTAPDAFGDQVPRGVQQIVGTFRDDELATLTVTALVLGQAVVVAVVPHHGGVDHRVSGVEPDLGVVELLKVRGGGVHHSLVLCPCVVRVVLVVELRGPEHGELFAFCVPVGFGSPGVTRVRRCHFDFLLVAPVHQVTGLPHHDGAAAVPLGLVPVTPTVDLQVCGDEVEGAVLG